jgi:hypothetical protein
MATAVLRAAWVAWATWGCKRNAYLNHCSMKKPRRETAGAFFPYSPLSLRVDAQGR